MPESVGSPALWIAFTVFVVGLLALDLGVFHRRAQVVTPREALLWSLGWIALALLFNVGVAVWFGTARGLEFLTGYLIEKALSVDNLFVFLVIFSYFGVPRAYQPRVLFWGVLGAIVMRAAFILSGAALLETFHWVVFVFGGFLVVTGLKILTQREAQVHPERNPLVRLVRRVFPAVSEYHGARFTIHRGGRRYLTPLALVLVVVETTDIVFAVDSIPAIFAVTRDPFIVYTSNIFAILGLRALYFLLAGIVGRFRYLKIGLGLVLVFVGVKMLLSDYLHIPVGVSLGVVGALLGASLVASWLRQPESPPLPRPAATERPPRQTHGPAG